MARETASSFALLAGCFVLTVLAWEWLYPVNVFVVVLHEWSHGLAAMLTGGDIVRIHVDARAGGWCEHTSSWRIVTAAAGYLGSSVLGAAILIAASTSRQDRRIAKALGAFLIFLAARYVRNPFGLGFCVAFGIFMIWVAVYASERLCDFLLRFLGTSTCLYAVVRVKWHLQSAWYGWGPVKTGDPTLDRIWASSDADTLASLTGVPALAWWVIFLLFGVAAFTLALRTSLRNEAGWPDP